MGDEELYRSNLDYRLRPVVEKILEDTFSHITNWDAVKITAALHFYISQKVDYVSRGSSPDRRRFRPPTEAWKRGGNCEEQSVLLSSLFASVRGVESKLVSGGKPDGSNHLLVFSGYRLGPDPVMDRLKQFYRTDYHFDYSFGSGFSWQDRENVCWFFSDPEFSDYIGDTGSLKRSGYVVDTSDGWEWYDKNYEINL